MRKELILEVAWKKFAERGYNTSLSEIAKASGIRKQTLYNYFSDKDALFLEVIETETEGYFTSKQVEFATFNQLNAEERLHKIFLSIFRYFSVRDRHMFWRWILLIDSESLKKACLDSLQVREKTFMAMIFEVFQVGITRGEIKALDIKSLMFTYYALIHGALESVTLLKDSNEMENYIQSIWQVFWQGIKKSD